MIIVLTLCYLACVLLAFKVIKIKVSPPTVAVAALIGVMMLGGIVIVWKQAAPMTGQMILRRKVLQVVPDVREYVSKVHVKPDQKVTKGDPLFEILPDRFQNAVDQAHANLTAAVTTVSQLEAAVTAAQAALKEELANTAAGKAEYQTAQNLQEANPGAIAGLTVEERRQALLAEEANDKVAEATLKQAQFSLAAAKQSVSVAQASLKTAQLISTDAHTDHPSMARSSTGRSERQRRSPAGDSREPVP